MKHIQPAWLDGYLERWATKRLGRMLERSFKGTVLAVAPNATSVGGLLVTIQRIGETGSDGNQYACFAPGYYPRIGDVVELYRRDPKETIVLQPAGSTAFVSAVQVDGATLTAAQPSVTLTAPPAAAGFAALQIDYQARGDTAATLVEVLVRFNGDTGNNYGSERVVGNGPTAPVAQENTASSGVRLFFASAASAAALGAGFGRIVIPNYLGTTFGKQCRIAWSMMAAASFGTSAQLWDDETSGYWNSSAAITSVTLLPATGNWAAGSWFAMFAS